MFRKLHVRLTLLGTGVTLLILSVFTAICLRTYESSAWKQEEAAFSANISALHQYLQTQSVLSHNHLRKMEAEYGIFLSVLDNGVPVLYQPSGKVPSDRDTLLEAAMETARLEYGIDLTVMKARTAAIYHTEYEIRFPVRRGKSQKILCSAAVLPRFGGTLGVLAIHPTQKITSQILRSRRVFWLCDLAAFFLLAGFFWFFTGRMLLPLQKNREKQMQFVASASHELRAPLAVLQSHIDAACLGSMDHTPAFFNTLQAECSRMSGLISDMLLLAGADGHTWSMHPEQIALDTLLLNTWEAYQPLALRKKQNLSIRLPDEPEVLLFCDPQRIRQLLAILMDNALCYTPEGGSITLELFLPQARHRGQQCTGKPAASKEVGILVCDNGPGIPGEHKAHVFDRFYRASTQEKNHYGLGLSIAAEIVRLHKGRILLTDTPGGGASFTVLLPKR